LWPPHAGSGGGKRDGLRRIVRSGIIRQVWLLLRNDGDRRRQRVSRSFPLLRYHMAAQFDPDDPMQSRWFNILPRGSISPRHPRPLSGRLLSRRFHAVLYCPDDCWTRDASTASFMATPERQGTAGGDRVLAAAANRSDRLCLRHV